MPAVVVVGLAKSQLPVFLTTTMMMLLVLSLLLSTVEAFAVSNIPTSTGRRTFSSRLSATPSDRLSLGLLTFDLDDTLFPTSNVIADANQVMIQFMQEQHIVRQDMVLSVSDFIAATRRIRFERKQENMPDLTYTDLRKLTIEFELARVNGKAPSPQTVDEIYNVWLKERHAAAERYLFPEVVPALKTLQAQYPDVCIAAITNGRGNPLEMPALAPYFEFCISGEDTFPYRKPHPQIYQTALRVYKESYSNHDNHIWCHVGDCLANDVGASADCGAYAVWYGPGDLATDNKESAASRLTSPTFNEPSWSTATTQDIEQRRKLADQAQEKIATRISNLTQLTNAIEELLSTARRPVQQHISY